MHRWMVLIGMGAFLILSGCVGDSCFEPLETRHKEYCCICTLKNPYREADKQCPWQLNQARTVMECWAERRARRRCSTLRKLSCEAELRNMCCEEPCVIVCEPCVKTRQKCYDVLKNCN